MGLPTRPLACTVSGHDAELTPFHRLPSPFTPPARKLRSGGAISWQTAL
ncbi:hypothetical protein HMPREF3039_00481 [Akkermansia sp. KLE1798]|nr:hypothetical protein HMPREF3039_00481 [Akkermansia sp. KLE1798]KZA05847.1 hypothetical protein HMPREF1326_00426 [Akkermansia sp. KLE1605]